MGKVILGIFIGFGLLAFIGLALSHSSNEAGSNGASMSHETGSQTALSVSAFKLWSDYQANEVAADNSYKGKHLVVQGLVSGINKDIFDKTYITLATPNEFMPIHARLSPAFVSVAADLTKGQLVLAECDGGGMIVGSPALENCSIRLVTRRDVQQSLIPENTKQDEMPQVAAPPDFVRGLMANEAILDDKCRDGSPDDTASTQACVNRDAIIEKIKAEGWCWGHEGQIEADKNWERCEQ